MCRQIAVKRQSYTGEKLNANKYRLSRIYRKIKKYVVHFGNLDFKTLQLCSFSKCFKSHESETTSPNWNAIQIEQY